MFHAAHTMEGTTLFVSELTNGVVCTLNIRDVGHGDHEKHIWKTSLPLLDHLYPHWVPKQPVNTQVDFVAQALKKAEEAFGWKILSSSKRFRFPESRFGDGLTGVVMYQEAGTSGLLTEYKSDKSVTFIERSGVSLGSNLTEHLKDFDIPVVLIVLNFLSVEIIECTPRFIGSIKRWEYKASKIVFETPQQFIEHISLKRFMPFVGTHVPENHIFNTILNYTYWKPIQTSSRFVSDLYRALTTSLLNELIYHTGIQKLKEGHVVVTGELPLFMNDTERVQLSVVDGLGLAGNWTIQVDEHAQFIPLMLSGAPNLFNELSEEKASLWVIPQVRGSKGIVSVKSEDTEYKAIFGNLYTYGIRKKLHKPRLEIKGADSDLERNVKVGVKSITFDLRPWPVVYGPNTIANSERIPMWIDRIRKELKVT